MTKTKRTNKKIRRLYTKLVILILCMIIVLRLFVLVLSKYESIADSNADVDIAFYLLKEDFSTMTTNLASIVPRDNAYTFNFSIGNQDGEKKAEVDLTYNLTIRTTTNLPLTYDLFMNQQYDDTDAVSIIKENVISQDEDMTYFRTITVDPVTLEYKTGTTNLYQLVVYFPESYNEENYQDVIEAIEITVDAKQVTS